MTILTDVLPAGMLAFAFAVALFAGMVKGVVGFAMPMIIISGLGVALSPELALAGLILPTLVTNGMQALREGARAAWGSIRRFRVFMTVGGLVLVASAQLFRILPQHVLFLMIGLPVTGFALIQLFGWQLVIRKPTRRIEAAIGAVSGFLGGLSGIWGPTTVAYLTALDTPKDEQMRAQGVIYGLGSLALFWAHLGSGVLNATTIPFSLLMVLPAVLGMWLGTRLRDRTDQATFRRVTLMVLLIAGGNLIRRGLGL
jgi:uncharacterized membrane protein YfcA